MKKWNIDDFDKLKLLYANTSNQEIAEILNSTIATVQSYAKKFELKKNIEHIIKSNSKAGTHTTRKYNKFKELGFI